jgi:hypothetical protein
VIEAARLGAHLATQPPMVLRERALHPLTDDGLAAFLEDWEAAGQQFVDCGPALAARHAYARAAVLAGFGGRPRP